MSSRFSQKSDSTVNVRSVLSYVPFFRGKLFCLYVSESLLNTAELVDALLDIDVLQEIGVRLLILVEGCEARSLYDHAVHGELRTALAKSTLDDAEALDEVRQILNRGQVPIIAAGSQQLFSPLIRDLCVSLEASKYIALIEGNDVPTQEGQPIHALLESKVSIVADVSAHDKDTLASAAEFCRSGIPRVHLLNGRHRGVLVDELFSEEGVGTMVHVDSYREMRPLKQEDIPELLSMIGRSVQDSKLVERTYEDVYDQMKDYYVLTLDDTIVGSLAVHLYPQTKAAEVACLYIKHRHEGLGYGRALVAFAERYAREAGMDYIFAISRSAVEFFRDRMRFEEWPRELLPESRRIALEKSGRDSGVFGHKL